MLLVTLLVVTILVSLAAWIGSYSSPDAVYIGPPTIYSTEPHGSKALAEAVTAMGIKVRPYRRRATTLKEFLKSSDSTLVTLLEPGSLSPAENRAMHQLGQEHNLLLAGDGNQMLIACFGYRFTTARDTVADSSHLTPAFGELLHPDTVDVIRSRETANHTVGRVTRAFRPVVGKMQIDSSRMMDATSFTCEVSPPFQLDTLLLTRSGQPVALRIRQLENGPVTTLVSDAAIFRNDQLRLKPDGSVTLSLFLDQGSEVLFDEYHHGYGQDGSIRDAVLDWTRRSPWGWAIWQLLVVGVLFLLTRAIRFGPIEPAVQRERRSSLEHVNALAAALSAAHGSDQAIALTVSGLRRRLSPNAPVRGNLDQWLSDLRGRVNTTRQQELVEKLQQLMRPGKAPEQVRLTALTVEELWQELRP